MRAMSAFYSSCVQGLEHYQPAAFASLLASSTNDRLIALSKQVSVMVYKPKVIKLRPVTMCGIEPPAVNYSDCDTADLL